MFGGLFDRADHPASRRTLIIAELSANHNGSLQKALELVHAASDAGADAIKLQTYTADTITFNSSSPEFIVDNPLWQGRTLYDLYDEARTPYEWHADLFAKASELNLGCFSTPFDPSSVEFLEQFDPPAYKIASFEVVDLPLIELVASKGRPVIMSTGMATLAEIAEAVELVKAAGVPLVLLKCTSAYPSPPDSMNLATIPHLSQAFDVPVGLSDHTLGIAVPVAAVTLGARVVEKHFTLSRNDAGPDSAFSLEPDEFHAMVQAVRVAEQAVGTVRYGSSEIESDSRAYRRSLYVVKNVAQGEIFNHENVRSIRPGYGLPPKLLKRVVGRRASRDLAAGTALKDDHVE